MQVPCERKARMSAHEEDDEIIKYRAERLCAGK